VHRHKHTQSHIVQEEQLSHKDKEVESWKKLQGVHRVKIQLSVKETALRS
jgi:hypothetical protein